MDDPVRDYSYQGPVSAASAAGRLMSKAIDLAIEEKSPFPDRAVFVDVDTPVEQREAAMGRAARDGMSVVLVSPDLTAQVVSPEQILERDAA